MSVIDRLLKPNVARLKRRHNVRGLVQALSYRKEEAVREDAAIALGDMRDSTVIPPLIQALKDSSPSVTQAVASALGHIFQTSDSWDGTSVREEAVTALSNIRESIAIPPLIQALRDHSLRVNEVAASALEHILETVNSPEAARALEQFSELRSVEHVLSHWSALRRYVQNSKHPAAIRDRIGFFQADDPAFVPVGSGNFKPSEEHQMRIILCCRHLDGIGAHFSSITGDLLVDVTAARVRAYFLTLQQLLADTHVNAVVALTTIAPLQYALEGGDISKDAYLEIAVNAMDRIVTENAPSFVSLENLKQSMTSWARSLLDSWRTGTSTGPQ